MSSKQRIAGVVAGVSMATAFVAVPVSKGAVQTLFTSNGFEASATPSQNYTSTGSNSLVGQPAAAPVAQQFSGLSTNTSGSGNIPTAGVFQYGTGVGATQQYVGLSGVNIDSTTTAEFFPNANVPGVAGSTIVTPSGTTGNSIVDITFNMSVYSTFSGDPEIGVIARDDTGKAVSSLLVDVASDKVLGTGFSPTLGSGNFYSYLLQLDYTNQIANIYAYPSNGGITSFTPATFLTSRPFTNNSATFQYAGLTEFSGAGAGATSTGYARFDNYTVITTVPEPASVSLLVGGLALAGGRRRRRIASR